MATRPIMARHLRTKLVGITAFAVVVVATPESLGGQEIPTGETTAAESPPDTGPIDTLSEWERFVYDRTARMTIPVSINGATAVPFIIDNGSERTVISRELAASLTLPPSKAMRLATVAGLVVADSYRIQHLANGGFVVSDFDAPALERRHMGVDGLIGIESLKDKVIVFDFAAQRMQVLPSRTAPMRIARREDAIIVSAKRKHGRLVLSDASIDGRRVDLVIDTGSQSSVGNLALKWMMAARLGSSEGSPGILIDVGGTSVATQVTSVPRIMIGKVELENLPIAYADSYALGLLGLDRRPAILLGMDALSLFDRVEIDFRRRKVKFVMPENPQGEAIPRRSTRTRHGRS